MRNVATSFRRSRQENAISVVLWSFLGDINLDDSRFVWRPWSPLMIFSLHYGAWPSGFVRLPVQMIQDGSSKKYKFLCGQTWCGRCCCGQIGVVHKSHPFFLGSLAWLNVSLIVRRDGRCLSWWTGLLYCPSTSTKVWNSMTASQCHMTPMLFIDVKLSAVFLQNHFVLIWLPGVPELMCPLAKSLKFSIGLCLTIVFPLPVCRGAVRLVAISWGGENLREVSLMSFATYGKKCSSSTFSCHVWSHAANATGTTGRKCVRLKLFWSRLSLA